MPSDFHTANTLTPFSPEQGEKQKTSPHRVAVIGLGNLLLMDDGVGVHAIKQLEKQVDGGEISAGNLVIAEVGTSALYSIGLFEEADVVIAIDAVKAGGKPGDIYVFDSSDAQVSHQNVSLHDLGIMGILRLLPEEKHPRVIVLGVEPACIDYGMELSGEIQEVLPRVVSLAHDMVQGIMRGDRP